ncbi:MAG: cytochrome c maturation protein CcmE, partial [Candidatus Korarchaeota archaeon]|nr:cytochrome c maturation protein CcmE [Candidatus Korarchaeota archaeon]
MRRGWKTWRREAFEIKIKYTYIMVIILIALSGVLAYDAFTSYMNPYLTVSQVMENSAAYGNEEEIRVIGTVANGSVMYEDGFMVFNLTDEESVIKVNYTGTSRPQGFQPGGQVVIIGERVSMNTIRGFDILVKCPSKYEGEGNS